MFNWRKPGPPNKKVPTVAVTFSETETDSNILNFESVSVSEKVTATVGTFSETETDSNILNFDTRTRDANVALTWVF